MPDTLLATKLYIPAVRPGAVSRPQLVEHLRAGMSGKLTLISGPAGFGKTSLVQDWVSGIDLPVAWLSLDEGDNHLNRFFSYLLAAFQQIDTAIGQSILNILNSPERPPIRALITTLVNNIAISAPPFIIVLDDYHHINDISIHEALRSFVEHQPDPVHLVVITREDPPLPLARLRAQGQMNEVRASHLRFTAQEADRFLNHLMGLGLSKEEVATLTIRTEGWIAGLQLAALTLRDQTDCSSFVQAFTGTDRHVMDYLVEEVLSCQSAEIQEFLIQTSLLHRLSGPLCDAVIGKNGGGGGESQAILEYLEQANLFVVPLDNQRVWYRYHHLFAQLLRARLHQVFPDLISTLYSKAANWCQQQGLIQEAMNYALAGADWELAADWLEQNAVSYLSSGEIASLVGWIEGLPKEVIHRRPKLSIELAWALTFANRLEEVEPLLHNTEISLDSSLENETSPAGLLTENDRRVIRASVALLRAYITLVSGNPSRAIQLANKVKQLLPDGNPVRSGCAREVMYTHWMSGYAYRSLGELSGAIDSFTQAVHYSRQTGQLWQTTVAKTDLAIVYRHRGQLNKAAHLFHEILHFADSYGVGNHSYLGRVESNLSLIYLEQNKLDEALHYASNGVASTQYWQSTLHLAGTLAHLALVQLALGDLKGAARSVHHADQARREYKVLPIVNSVVDYAQVRLWLRQGNLAAAERWVDEFRIANRDKIDSRWPADESLEVNLTTLARVLLAKWKERSDQALYEECRRLLDQLSDTFKSGERTNALIEIGALQSILLFSRERTRQNTLPPTNNHSKALKALATTLELAEPEGYVRIFVDEGQPMAELLYQVAAQGIFPEYCGKLLTAFPEAEITQGASPTAMEELIEPLSEREVEVLQLISEGLSNSEIALRLSLSLNTIKGHTRNIYSKLNVNSRTQAISRAKALGILSL